MIKDVCAKQEHHALIIFEGAPVGVGGGVNISKPINYIMKYLDSHLGNGE